MRTEFKVNDGGREVYFKGEGGDCVTRAIVIASGMDYKKVYDILAAGNKSQRRSKHDRNKSKDRTLSALHGINVKRKWFKDQMAAWGFIWVPTMFIGSGCQVHLCKQELPVGRLVVAVSGHYTSMIEGVINDSWNPSRIWTSPYTGQELKTNQFIHEDGKTIHEESRCVYGYWEYPTNNS
tara:strand:- start:44470 stop:45009 length:540 start_codon:yes stop_codon:yes gene_type:complete